MFRATHRRKRPMSRQFGLSRECRPSGIVGLGATPDGKEAQCAIRPLGIEPTPARVIGTLRGQASEGAVKSRQSLRDRRSQR